MTKAEATAIFASTRRALAILEQRLWADCRVAPAVQDEMYKEVKGAAEEIQRVHDMAKAELDK